MYIENNLILDEYLHSIIKDMNKKYCKNIIKYKENPSILKYYYQLKSKTITQRKNKYCLII